MKSKFILMVALLIGMTVSSFAQSINGKPIADLDAEYVQIVGTKKLLSNKVTVQIDFGQVDRVFKSKDTQILDANGKRTTFNSMIDALNFMNKAGYEFVNAYAITVGNQNVYHYMLKRKKK